MKIIIMIVYILNIYKLNDVGILSNLIGSLSLANGQCPPHNLQRKTMAGVNSHELNGELTMR